MSSILLYEGASPGAPAAGTVLLYPKADGKFYFKADDGVEHPFNSDASVSASNNLQTGTSYTIQESDSGNVILFSNAAAIAVTLPDGLLVNFHCSIIQVGAGVPTITPATDTVNGAGSGVTPSAQWKAIYLNKYDTGKYIAVL